MIHVVDDFINDEHLASYFQATSAQCMWNIQSSKEEAQIGVFDSVCLENGPLAERSA